MGFTLLEAMACGTPAICSNVAGMPEYVLDGETGYVFDDLPMLTDRLRRLANDPDLVERLGRQARRQVEQEYDFRVAGARMVAVYEPLIARVAGGGRVKILVLSNLYPPDVIGGYELGCKQAVDALRARGHDVRVLTIAPRTPVPAEPHVLRALKLSEVWNSNRYVLGAQPPRHQPAACRPRPPASTPSTSTP